MVKALPAMPETRSSIPGSERYPGEGNGNPLQYSSLENCTVRATRYDTIYTWGHKEWDMTEQLTHYMDEKRRNFYHIILSVFGTSTNWGTLNGK